MGDHTHSHITNPGYAQPLNTPYNQNYVSNTSTDGYFPITYSSFPTPTPRPYDYHNSTPETTAVTASGSNYVPTTSASEEYLEDGGVYYGGTEASYGGAYYGQVNQVNHSSWVTGRSDVPSFTATTGGGGDYYYSHVADQQNVRTTRA